MRNGPYILVVAPTEYPGMLYRGKYAYEHHIAWWLNTGDVIDGKLEVIHHVNEDKHDNRFENLERKTKSSHSADHSTEPATEELRCSSCGSSFTRTARYIRAKLKFQNNKRFFCNRKCYRNQKP